MAARSFHNPTTVAGILDVLDAHKDRAVIVNGGTDIVKALGDGSVTADAVVYIRNVRELDYIREQDGYVAVGGITSYRSILESPLCKPFTGLMEAVAEIGSPPIRVVATPAGNIATAASGADCNVALTALGASVVLAGKSGERVSGIEEFFAGADRKTGMRPDELIREIRIPVTGRGSSFIKLAKRKAQDIAQVSACVSLQAENGVCKAVTVALGAVSRKVVRAFSMEARIVGKKVDDAVAALKNVVPAEASLRSPRNRPYKEAVIGVIVGRALKNAYAEIAGSN
jgi:carbon-monoxide dehydrogenase medium subunit